MSIQSVPAPELHPFMCLVCHAHRCEAGWVSLDVDLLDGHAYLCGDCANSVTHAVGGATSDVYQQLRDCIDDTNVFINQLRDELEQEKARTVRVVSADEIVPYLKKAEGRPRKDAEA